MSNESGWGKETANFYAERKSQMRSLRRSGFTLHEIGKKFGVSRQRVFQILGLKDNPPPNFGEKDK